MNKVKLTADTSQITAAIVSIWSAILATLGYSKQSEVTLVIGICSWGMMLISNWSLWLQKRLDPYNHQGDKKQDSS